MPRHAFLCRHSVALCSTRALRSRAQQRPFRHSLISNSGSVLSSRYTTSALDSADPLTPLPSSAHSPSSQSSSTSYQPAAQSSAWIKSIPPTLLSFHSSHPTPTPANLKYATAFFRRAPPVATYIASSLWQVPQTSSLPEVAFLGRSNVGKSTLLNALLGHAICRTSSKPGRTRALHAYAVGGHEGRTGEVGALAVLDVPGYGHGGHREWEVALSRYLGKRRELRRAYVLVDSQHGVKDSDAHMLQFLRERGVPHQVVLSKVDKVIFRDGKMGRNISEIQLQGARKRLEDVVQQVHHAMLPQDNRSKRDKHDTSLPEEVLCASADLGRYKALANEPGGTLGIAALRWSILRATGFERERKAAKRTEPEILIDKDR